MLQNQIAQLNNQIQNFETRFEKRQPVKMAVGFALRMYVVYSVADVPDPKEYLHKANYIVSSSLRKNQSDLRLFWLGIYFAIELGHFDKANEMLDNAYAYRSYYKNNKPFDYKALLFLYSYLEIKQKRAKSARKHMRTLESAIGGDSAVDSLMMGILHLAFYEYEEAYGYLSQSYRAGCRSVFLFTALFNYYRTAVKEKNAGEMLLKTVHWALNRGANVEAIITVYQDELLQREHIELGEQIYRQFPNQWILRELCSYYMTVPDYGPKAYAYYRDAERRQIYLPYLSQFIVRAAFENGSERVHRYTMAQYLRNPALDNTDLLVYVYHLLLTDPALADLAEDKVKDILKMAVHCLEDGIRGRYANSLYYFFWIKCNEQQISGKNVDKAEKILQEDLCKFEITFPEAAGPSGSENNVRYLYVNEPEKKGIAEYEFPSAPDRAAGESLVIEAVSGGFRYIGLSGRRARVLESGVTAPLEIRRLVASAGTALYRHFYDKGLRNFEVAAYLAKSYIQTRQKEEQDYGEILEAVIANPEASEVFKTQCSVALGQLYYKLGQFDKALACYDKVNENALEDSLLEHMLAAYIRQKVYAGAAGLVERKWHRIGDKVLFEAVKALAAPSEDKWHSSIVNAAYQLLLRSKYDKSLLDVVLTYFNGTQEQWLELYRALFAISVQESRLDEIILKNAAWAYHFDDKTQKVFVRMTASEKADDKNKVLKDFIYYAIYEMIVNNAKPLPETIAALEAYYEAYPSEALREGGDKELLAYGLSHVYLNHNITTVQSDAIIKDAISAQKASSILFPVFKGSKRIKSTYIEMYRPFMYRCLPGKNVRLYYKVDDEEDWRGKTMDYWRFGLYLTCIPHFYNEGISYYFSEELPTGSISTKKEEIRNTEMFLYENTDENHPSLFFVINNATIYEQMFRYEQVEEIISALVKDVKTVQSKLM